ncbi:MAG: hypothetical protein KJ914_08640 [Gammaproteobacteria bacterium]|nr:hypothetical protein [Gammaproteobacteria bacterium]MBU1724586.1 hypothetical protein [Gammaproteobacteria bacterium]
MLSKKSRAIWGDSGECYSPLLTARWHANCSLKPWMQVHGNIKACEILGLSQRTLQRWNEADASLVDRRTLRTHPPTSSVRQMVFVKVVVV